MKEIKFIANTDIHPEDLIIKDNKLRINPTKLESLIAEKGKESKQYILEVLNPSATQIIQDANTNGRKMVIVNGMGVGIVSLDFICRINNTRTVAFRMPEGAPLPTQNLTVNAGSGLLWWNAGSRDIIFSQIQNNQRIVLNIVGMFA